jgi:hypothetical protein
LKYVRKEEDIWNNVLKSKIKEYIDNLNYWFDFIAPFTNKFQLDDITIIEKQIKEGIISTDFLQNTYKNTLSKEAIKVKSKQKKWLRIFIDIVDMWIMNISDFKNLAWDINSWKIWPENISSLLEAWKTATNKFQNLLVSLKKEYKDIQISLWWDEIFIFLPERDEAKNKTILKDISEKLDGQDLVWRISSSTNKNNEKIFDHLDWLTSVSKFFEKIVERIINNDKNTIFNKSVSNETYLKELSLSSININIENSIQILLLEKSDDFIINLQKSIDNNKIKEILSWKSKTYFISLNYFKKDKDWNIIWELQKFDLKIEKWTNKQWIPINKELIISIK